MECTNCLANLALTLTNMGVDITVCHDKEDETRVLYIGDDYVFEFNKHGDVLVEHGPLLDCETEIYL